MNIENQTILGLIVLFLSKNDQKQTIEINGWFDLVNDLIWSNLTKAILFKAQ